MKGKTRYRYDVRSTKRIVFRPVNVIGPRLDGGPTERGPERQPLWHINNYRTLALIHINGEPCFMLFMALTYYSTNLFVDIKMKP